MDIEIKKDRLIFIIIILSIIGITLSILALVDTLNKKEKRYYYFVNNSCGLSNDCYTNKNQDHFCLNQFGYGYIQVESYYTTD